MIAIRTESEIVLLRRSAEILVEAFTAVKRAIKPGISTGELDSIAEDTIRSRDARPAFKGYNGFPASICASIDNEVVHGIPGKRQLKEGDILSVDLGVEKNGYFSDAAKTFAIGSISQKKTDLMKATHESLYLALEKCKKGNTLGDISSAIQRHVESKGFSIVRDLVGHGIGTQLHEEPQIPNYGAPNRGPKLKNGMVFAIEPMVNLGGYRVQFMDDGWTVETLDGSPSAHFEHTVVLRNGGCEILTLGIEEI
ncbi:type I methionyl aminopeptidase [bacterium]|nr:type I methionyl aminopeptidase [bacterium]